MPRKTIRERKARKDTKVTTATRSSRSSPDAESEQSEGDVLIREMNDICNPDPDPGSPSHAGAGRPQSQTHTVEPDQRKDNTSPQPARSIHARGGKRDKLDVQQVAEDRFLSGDESPKTVDSIQRKGAQKIKAARLVSVIDEL
ncbi:hypothetical protein BCR39DRAFT_554104 [Naematelia encephala]|uniref:Uncharacterized protein n=1 Tax=Naematelia encephala TaxID=71784 RepID=A0A1Y2AF55_9TREE|nr:hypothetical protein BCR39DRAFT_554104 [Naematelia encephala]